MPNSAQLQTFTAGVETAVDVAQIERQLHELWQLAAESEKDPSRRQITRACLFNFIVYCETDEQAAHASEPGVAHLGAAVLPLLESDLPTVIWWQGDFLKRTDLFRRLVAVADRVIYDTSTWIDPQSQLAPLARRIAEHPRCNFVDLSWTRLGLWRRLTAEF